jgi:hypothetical protein
MEQVIIQDCGCIALPESIATALDLRRGMTLDIRLNEALDTILLTPHYSEDESAEDSHSRIGPAASCVILPPSR